LAAPSSARRTLTACLCHQRAVRRPWRRGRGGGGG
jgi:hypothetical protein